MLTDLTIKHLRGLADASGMHLPDLGRTLNLLCGSSGVGKTTVLEAISLLLDHNGLSLHTRNDLISGHVGLNYLVNLQAQPVLATIRAFGDWGPHARSLTLWEEFNPCCRHMVYEHDNGESYDWTKWLNPPDPPEEDPVLPPRPLASYLGGHTDPIGLDGLISWYLSKGTLYAILPLLQAVEPRLQQLMILHLDQHSQIFFQLEDLDQPVPWALGGEGLQRMLYLVWGMVQSKVLLIENLEQSLHHRVMAAVCRELVALARLYQRQIFATTQSAELITAAAGVAESDPGQPEEVVLYCLQREDTHHTVVRWDHNMLRNSMKSNIEVR